METKETKETVVETERKSQWKTKAVVKTDDGISDELVELLDVAIARRHSKSADFPLDLLGLIASYISAIRDYVSVDDELKQTHLQWLPLYNLGYQWTNDILRAVSRDMKTVAAVCPSKKTLTVFQPNGDPNDDSGRLVIPLRTTRPENIRFGPSGRTIAYDDYSIGLHHVVQFKLRPIPTILTKSQFGLSERYPSQMTVVEANGTTLFSSHLPNLTCLSNDEQRACALRCISHRTQSVRKTVKYACSIYERANDEMGIWKWRHIKQCELQVPDRWAKNEARLAVNFFHGTPLGIVETSMQYDICIVNPFPRRKIKIKRLLPYWDQAHCIIIREADGYTKQELQWYECPFSKRSIWTGTPGHYHVESGWMLARNDPVAKLVKTQLKSKEENKNQKQITPRARSIHEIIAVQSNNANGRVHTICKFRKAVHLTCFLPMKESKGVLALLYDKKLWKVVLLKRQGPLILL